ncbi:hypothetical protein H70357_24600 [Paenibacillus sp. FSL H7-0357]|uniref:RusA family crossover junction endodeoxyribonuclease n=1 Tax=Paenibacillus sp. FSL H7-0357 TaxID=1536774 RepID=UPI0004F8178C|nr:RusA family crossover junction endodeoxyribonuclease [Paenibacillus sp. FSL H7-0357]AIQ19539.1 hypothetical protein H70357_24600 [Paenibacillus sp. FSL H7-0357]
MIKFTVYGAPVAQGRPRATTATGFVKMYDPAKSKHYKDYVRLASREYAPPHPLQGALGLEVIAYRPLTSVIRKSLKKAAAAEKGEILPLTKPDADNYLKGITDALTNIMWVDDSQVVEATVKKRYSAKPRIEISIWEVSA